MCKLVSEFSVKANRGLPPYCKLNIEKVTEDEGVLLEDHSSGTIESNKLQQCTQVQDHPNQFHFSENIPSLLIARCFIIS